MAKTSNYWDKRAIKRMTEAEKHSEAYINRIKKIYEQAYRNVNREINRVYWNYSKDTGLDIDRLKELLTRSETEKLWEQMKKQGLDRFIKNNYKSRISRLEQIQAQIYAKAKLIYPKEELEQTMCYKGVVNNSYYKAVYDTQMGTGYDFGFNKIDKNLLDTILNEKWSGKNYSQRIWKNTDILAESVSQLVGGALLSGQSIQKTSREIKERFRVSKYYAERLVRTETNHFNNEADALAYEEMGVDQYVFVATLDDRTSPMCQSHDNKKYKYKDREVGVNYPPLHPNCRSTTRGYLGEEAEANLQRRARNPKTGKTELIGNISYEEWAKNNGLAPKMTVKGDNNLKNMSENDKLDTSKWVKRTDKLRANPISIDNKQLDTNTLNITFKSKLMEFYERNRIEQNLNLAPIKDLMDDPFNTFDVDFGNMDNKLANNWANQFENLSEEYYSTTTKIKQDKILVYDPIHNQQVYEPRIANQTEIYGNLRNSTIIINDNLTDYNKHINIIKANIDTKHFVKIAEQDYDKYVATHEFAHTLSDVRQKTYKDTVTKDIKKIKKFNDEITSIYKEYQDEILSIKVERQKLNNKFVMDTLNFTEEDEKRNKELKDKIDNIFISSYADENEDEFMAEAFVDYKLGTNKSSYSIRVGNLIDKYFKRGG